MTREKLVKILKAALIVLAGAIAILSVARDFLAQVLNSLQGF